MEWEEYFDSVFRRGIKVNAAGKETAWDRIRLCFDYWCDGVGVGEARSLLRVGK
jgi:hypothetical protein